MRNQRAPSKSKRDETIQNECLDPRDVGVNTTHNKNIQYECVDPTRNNKAVSKAIRTEVIQYECTNPREIEKSSSSKKDVGVCCKNCRNNGVSYNNKNIQYECIDKSSSTDVERKKIGTSSNFKRIGLDETSYKCLKCPKIQQNDTTELDETSYKELPNPKRNRSATKEAGVDATVQKNNKKIGTCADTTTQTIIPKVTHEIVIKIISEDTNARNNNEQKHAKIQTNQHEESNYKQTKGIKVKERKSSENSIRCNICNCYVGSCKTENLTRKRKTSGVGCRMEDTEVVDKIKYLISASSSSGGTKNQRPHTPVQSLYINKKYENLLEHYIKYHKKSCGCLKKS